MTPHRPSTLYLRVTPLATAAVLSCAQAAWAQTAVAPADTTLAPVTVKARPVEDGDVISAKALADAQAKDAREALQSVPGISVGGGGNAIAQKVYVRGLEDTLLGITLDGAPQGGYLYHHQGRLLIDPGLLKSVQVQRAWPAPAPGQARWPAR